MMLLQLQTDFRSLGGSVIVNPLNVQVQHQLGCLCHETGLRPKPKCKKAIDTIFWHTLLTFGSLMMPEINHKHIFQS